MVIKGNNTKRLLLSITLVMFLLGTCGVVDSVNSSEDTITNIKDRSLQINTSDKIIINGSTAIDLNNTSSVIEPKKTDKIYTIKEKTTKKIRKYPTITVKGYPTCYTCWRTQRYRKTQQTYINYCPNCRRYGTLRNNPKHVQDGEITCSRCDCDFCCHCGRDKVGSGGRHNWNILKKA